MKRFRVIYTELAECDLREIHEYIALTLLEPVYAKSQSKRIIDAAAGLGRMPERFRLYDKEPWHGKGLRIMPVDNYLVFYLLSESKGTVAIIRIMYGGRDIDEQLKLTETVQEDGSP